MLHTHPNDPETPEAPDCCPACGHDLPDGVSVDEIPACIRCGIRACEYCHHEPKPGTYVCEDCRGDHEGR